MKRYESRYCTFAVPDDWVAGPPFAFTGRDATGERWTAQVLERCLLKALPAAAQLQQQKAILPHLYAGFELVSEGSFRPEGIGEGFTLTFRFLDNEENESHGQAFNLILGSLFCQLVLACPDRPDRERDRLFAAINKTFAFRQVEFLSKANSPTLTSETLRNPQPVAEQGWPSGWRKFPRACVSLPMPFGWEVAEEDGDTIFRRGSAEIRLHRDLEGHGDPGNWFADRMKQLQTSGDLLLGSESGKLDRGPYAALLYEEKGVGRNWRTAAVTRTLELFLSGRQSLLWSLKAPEAGFPDLRSLFEALVASCEFLDPVEWETKLPEPWIDYILRGPWQVEGKGCYANFTGTPVLVHLKQELSTLPLETLKDSVFKTAHQELKFKKGFSEHFTLGVWHQCEALHYGADSSGSELVSEFSIRTVWLIENNRIFYISVRGRSSKVTEGFLNGLLENFEPARLKQ